MRYSIIVVALVATMGAAVLPASEDAAGAALGATSDGTLMAVTAVSSDDVWAVGEGSDGAALIEHWDGTSWRRVDGPKLGRRTELSSVSAISATDIWAAGTYFEGRHDFERPVIVRWDGQSWTQVPFAPAGVPTYLTGIAALSSDDVWVDGGIQAHSIVYHWNGSSWLKSKVKHQETELGRNGLSDIDASSPDQMWVVGSAQKSADHIYPIAQLWQGDHWRLVPPAIPPHGQYADLSDVESVGPDLAWAVGEAYDVTGLYGLVERWDGSAWTVASVRGESLGATYSGVEASSESDGWAVGAVESSQTTALLAHWNGRHWRQVPPPEVDGNPLGGYLHGVTALSSDDVWAVGWNPAGGHTTATILHWDGSTWTVMAS